jgi:hypothetical protein
LPLRLCDEAETGAVAGEPGEGADRERACIPQRIEQAGPATQLVDARCAPGEMVGFLAGRLHQCRLGRRAGGYSRLPLVQRLGRDLTGMIHPHQGSGVSPLGRLVNGLGNPFGGVGPAGRIAAEQGPQGLVDRADQAVDRGVVAGGRDSGHGRQYRSTFIYVPREVPR